MLVLLNNQMNLGEPEQNTQNITSQSNGDVGKKELSKDEPELIINYEELENIGDNMYNNDFMKYLDVEGADNDSIKNL